MAGAVAIGNLAYDAAKSDFRRNGVVKDSLSAYADSEHFHRLKLMPFY